MRKKTAIFSIGYSIGKALGRIPILSMFLYPFVYPYIFLRFYSPKEGSFTSFACIHT